MKEGAGKEKKDVKGQGYNEKRRGKLKENQEERMERREMDENWGKGLKRSEMIKLRMEEKRRKVKEGKERKSRGEKMESRGRAENWRKGLKRCEIKLWMKGERRKIIKREGNNDRGENGKQKNWLKVKKKLKGKEVK